MDAIDRQAAIDYIKSQRGRLFKGFTIEEAVLTLIREVPSVQPDIIRCKDCKYYGEHWYCEAWNNSPGFPVVDVDGYCNLAERREE